MEVADYVKITAPTQKGLLYGGISVTQILYQDTNKIQFQKELQEIIQNMKYVPGCLM